MPSPQLCLFGITLIMAAAVAAGEPAGAKRLEPTADAWSVDFRWGVKIPLRDGVHLNATLYTPNKQSATAPCLFTLTPYTSERYHNQGIYFAAHGYPFLTVDVRGRGNSEGVFHPFIQGARDGYDIVEWLARQPYCNGKVAMWGGSYAGYEQWATAKEFPQHLATIVPVASPYVGLDFPMVANISAPYYMQWLTLTSGRTGQWSIFEDKAFWTTRFLRWFEFGARFEDLDTQLGNPSSQFHEWLSHPYLDDYWDAYNPTPEQYARLRIPILTITGSHDADQLGALAHYRNYMANATPEARTRHYLVIGPWDHAGTGTPKTEFGGLSLGPHTLLDMAKLHLRWYAWAMQGGGEPDFLKKRVTYYVMYADRWRYADSLEAITADTRTLYLDSTTNATDVLSSGTLVTRASIGSPDHYVYDPRDLSTAELESTVDPDSLVDQRMIYALRGKELVYHSMPFERDTEISGFFELTAWVAIDQPDTDFVASIYEIREDGTSVLLTSDQLRARYRESLRESKLIHTKAPLRYDFAHFTFVSQEVKKGSRLRLVVRPLNSLYSEKNYNSGGTVSKESMRDARPVTVTLYHDRAHPSALLVPLGRPVAADEVAPPESMFTTEKR